MRPYPQKAKRGDSASDNSEGRRETHFVGPVVEELLVLRISSNFGVVVHSAKYNSVNETHFF